jgi:hypothetical protein
VAPPHRHAHPVGASPHHPRAHPQVPRLRRGLRPSLHRHGPLPPRRHRPARDPHRPQHRRPRLPPPPRRATRTHATLVTRVPPVRSRNWRIGDVPESRPGFWHVPEPVPSLT